jgi:hypothetical protein
VNFRVSLQVFLGTVVGIIVNHGEGEGKGHIQAGEKVGQTLNVLQSVEVYRHKCNVNGQDGTPLFTNRDPPAPG